MYYYYSIFLALDHGSSIAFFEVNIIVYEYHAIVIWLWYHLSAFLWRLNVSWGIKHDFCSIFNEKCLVLSVKLINITKTAKRSSDLEVTLFLNPYYRCSLHLCRGQLWSLWRPRSVGLSGAGWLGPETVGYEKHAVGVDLALLLSYSPGPNDSLRPVRDHAQINLLLKPAHPARSARGQVGKLNTWTTGGKPTQNNLPTRNQGALFSDSLSGENFSEVSWFQPVKVIRWLWGF